MGIRGVTIASSIGRRDTEVIPQRLQPVRENTDPLDLFTLIINSSGLRPMSLSLDVMRAEPGENADNITKYRSVLKSLLDNVTILELKLVPHHQHDRLEEIFREVVGSGHNCSLKALAVSNPVTFNGEEKLDRMGAGVKDTINLVFLSRYLFTLPTDDPSLPRYRGLSVLELGSALEPSSLPHLTALLQQQVSLKHIHICLLDNCRGKFDKHSESEKELYSALWSLFKRSQFALLSIGFVCHHTFVPCRASSIKCHNFFPFSDLLKHFMRAECKNNQYLILGCVNSGALPLLKGAGSKAPDCGVRHKILRYDINDINVIVPHLLQLPVIRLQELCINIENEGQSIICLLYTSPSPRDATLSRMPSSA